MWFFQARNERARAVLVHNKLSFITRKQSSIVKTIGCFEHWNRDRTGPRIIAELNWGVMVLENFGVEVSGLCDGGA
jgi:hypothetical protein